MFGQKKTEKEMIKKGFMRQMLYYVDSKKNQNHLIASQCIGKMFEIIEKCKDINQYDLAATFANDIAQKLAQSQDQEALIFF